MGFHTSEYEGIVIDRDYLESIHQFKELVILIVLLHFLVHECRMFISIFNFSGVCGLSIHLRFGSSNSFT